MIGKIMSEAAHSIIGMFSAKPSTMEHNASNSDFGSLLLSPEEEPHSNFTSNDIGTLDLEEVGTEDVNPASVQAWDTTHAVNNLDERFGSKIFDQNRALQKIELNQATFNQAGMINSDPMHGRGSIALSCDEQAGQVAAGVTSDILSAQAKVPTSNGSKIDMAPHNDAMDVVDGRSGNDKPRLVKMDDFQIGSPLHKNTVNEENFPGSDKELLKLRNLQSQTPGESDEPQALPAKISNFPYLTKVGEQETARSGLDQSGSRSLSPSVAASDRQKLNVADGDFAESVKQDLQPKIKNLESSIDQQPLTNFPAQLAVRETIQKPVSFDMSAPQVAERLAAEIADISVAGGPKKFEINPRNLGRMEIIFTTRGSTEIVEIQTDHRVAKDIIVQHSQLLQDILKSQGRDDLTLRVDVKENAFPSSRADGGNLAQQENRDPREQQPRPSQHRQMKSSFDGTTESDPASDSSRYA